MKSVAIYTRVSSEQQKEGQTIESQVAALREYAQAEGYGVVDEWVFRDEGYSGATLVRPGLERVRDLAAEGQIEAVLVYGPDRLSRRYAYQVLLLEEFARNGVEVVFLNSPQAKTAEEELLVQFQGMIAEYERAQITERTRRGKRHRAKGGSVNVLSGAPYGYRYVKKTQTCEAYYERIDSEAAVVREVYRLYTVEALSIGGIVRWLESQGVSTRKGQSPWERSTVWQMLRNPAYKGTACFGKTQIVPRRKVTRRLRQRGGFSTRCSANQERCREDWIEIPVPALVSEETFALAQERLQKNKQLSIRHTQEPTLLQGMLVCRQCGYAYYRTSTRTSKRKLYYYRCLGSDDYRYANGRGCESRPIRQDFLDALVWRHVLQLLEDPTVIRSEIDRRLREIQKSSPTKCRKETLVREETRLQNGIDKILDAYQEGLLSIDELRDRVPSLRKRQDTIQSELRSLDQQTADEQTVLRLAQNIEGFLSRLRQSAEHLEVTEQQKILRLIVKEILVGSDVVTIKHSIPVGNGHPIGTNPPSYLLCTRSALAALVQYCLGRVGRGVGETRVTLCEVCR
jgi:site-specific DNA recombinase